MADVNDYLSLITSEHQPRPKFMATVDLLAGAMADLQNVLLSLPDLYDLDVAVGDQLDTVGLWVGVSRNVKTPLTGVYFSLDDPLLGFDHGVWQGPFDPTTGITVLDDTTFRMLIRTRIQANHWDGTLDSSADIINSIFGQPVEQTDFVVVLIDGTPVVVGSGAAAVPLATAPQLEPTPGASYVFIQDNGDMSITVGVAGQVPNALFLALLAGGYIPLKPEGVRVNYYVVTSQNGSPVFGFDISNQYIAGLDSGAWARPL